VVKLAGGLVLRYGRPMATLRQRHLAAMLLLVACQDRSSHHRPAFDGPPLERFGVANRDTQGHGADRFAANHPISSDSPGSSPAKANRPVVVLKVDDFGGPLSRRAARFIEAVAAVGGVAALGLITSRLPEDPEVLATYRDLQARGFELWFHGHRHDWSLPEAEFAGVGVAAQREAFRIGLAVAHERLGMELRTFGAPGNAIDDDTVTAIREFPQLDAWFFGRPGTQATVLPRLLEVEEKVGVVREPDAFFVALDRQIAAAPAVITLQVHPNALGADDFARFETILTGLRRRGLRLTTPREVIRAQR